MFAGKMTKFIAALLLCCVMPPAVCAAADYKTHTVAPGESLSKIAALYGVTAQEIAELNDIGDINHIKAGQVLKIPGTEAEETTAAETTAEETAAEETTAAETTAADKPAGSTTYITSYENMSDDMSTVVSVNFDRSDVHDVLSAFAINLGYNFIYKGVPTEVTLKLNDVTIGEALDYVMKLTDMTYLIDGRTVIVGKKNDLAESFGEALQLTEFKLRYVTADVIMSQITALKIAVTTTESGGNEYSFIAQGLPTDLSKVRDLIAMIDKKENSMLGPETITSNFYTVGLVHITADDLQTVLASAKLPVGVVLPKKPQTLYIFASSQEYKTITNIVKAVDTENPEVPVTGEEQIIKQVDLKYVTLDLIESQVSGVSGVSIIKIATNKTTCWLNGTAAQIKKAEELFALLDTESNAQKNDNETKEQLNTITLENITAEQFNSTLQSLSLPTGVIFPDNEKSLYINATPNVIKTINEVKAIVDKPENTASAETVQFVPVTLKFITAEQFNETLRSLQLPTGIIFPDNKNTVFLYVTTAEIESIDNIKRVVDTAANAAATTEEIKAVFRPVMLKFITAEQFNETLKSLQLPTGITFPDNLYMLYINATESEFASINDALAVVDIPANIDYENANEVFVKVQLINIDKKFAIPFIEALDLNIKVIDIENMQKEIWLKGPQSEVYKAQTSIYNIDTNGANIVYSYRSYRLKHISAEEMSEKIAALNLPNVKVHTVTMSSFSRNILVSFSNDMENTIDDIVRSLDVPEDYVTLMVDTIDGSKDDPDLEMRINERIRIISVMSGIDINKFKTSDNISKTENPRFIIYLENATLAEVKRAREIVEEIGTGEGKKTEETTAAETTAAP